MDQVSQLDDIRYPTLPPLDQEEWKLPKPGLKVRFDEDNLELTRSEATLQIPETETLDDNSTINSYSSREDESAFQIPETVMSEAVGQPANFSLSKEDDREEGAFRIPEAVLSEAQKIQMGSDQRYWEYSLYKGPQGERVKVLYCNRRENAERIAQSFLDEKVIGFDLEWKQNAMAFEGPRKNVSLIQIATQSRIALFHIGVFPRGPNEPSDLITPSLRKIIESPSITKLGVAIKADCTRLRRTFNVEPRGLFELSHLYKLVSCIKSGEIRFINKILVRLAAMADEYLPLPLYKGDEVRGSDWSQRLTSDQIRYAASDPYACVHIHDILQKERLALNPVPPNPYHAELNLPIRTTDYPVSQSSDEDFYSLDEEDEESSDESLTTSLQNRSFSSDMDDLTEEFSSSVSIDCPPVRTSSKNSKSPKPQAVLEANAWVKEYRESKTKPCKSPPAQLRAYALWHLGGFEIAECANLLRDPPLKVGTVMGYVLDAVKSEKLDCDPHRLKTVLDCIPSQVQNARYKALKRRTDSV